MTSIEQPMPDETLDPTEESISGMENQYLTFFVDGQKFSVAVRDVVQIVNIQPITPVPGYPEYAKGIIEVREAAVPVIDLRLRFHRAAQEYNDRTCIIVLMISDMPFGFVADAADAVVDIRPEDITPTPRPVAGQTESEFLSGIFSQEGQLILMLDAEKIISLEAAESMAAGAREQTEKKEEN